MAVTPQGKSVKRNYLAESNRSFEAESTMRERKHFLERTGVDLSCQKKELKSLMIRLSDHLSIYPYLRTSISLKDRKKMKRRKRTKRLREMWDTACIAACV